VAAAAAAAASRFQGRYRRYCNSSAVALFGSR